MEKQKNQITRLDPDMHNVKKVSLKRITTIIIIIAANIAVIAAIIAGLLLWKIPGKKGSKKSDIKNSAAQTQNTLKNSSPEDQCLDKFHDPDLCRFESWIQANPIQKIPYSATITAKSNGLTFTNIYKRDKNGNISMNMKWQEQQPLELNIIEYNGNTYMQGSNMFWVKFPIGFKIPTDSKIPSNVMDPSSNFNFMDSLQNDRFTKMGKEPCDNNLMCFEYKVSESGMVNQYIWFDTKEYQLRKLVAGSPGGTTEMKLGYKPVTVTAPPAQNVVSPALPNVSSFEQLFNNLK